MIDKPVYKFGLYGKCGSCKSVNLIVCDKCGKSDMFTDSVKPGHIYCTSCGNDMRHTCSNLVCNRTVTALRTPKNLEEKKVIERFLEAQKEKESEKEPVFASRFFNEEEDTSFYDGDKYIDKKLNFTNSYTERVYFDCKNCKEEKKEIICPSCKESGKFSLNYDSIACSCGYEFSSYACDCGAFKGHGTFYVICNDAKVPYDISRSYYNYRKGRMIVFSSCSSCLDFTAEKCQTCGSRVNFGKPNRFKEVYCKNCGSINRFTCMNLGCDQKVKDIEVPQSLEEQLSMLQRSMKSKKRRKKSRKPGADVGKRISSSSIKSSFTEELEKDTRKEIEEFRKNSFAEETNLRSSAKGKTLIILYVLILILLVILTLLYFT